MQRNGKHNATPYQSSTGSPAPVSVIVPAYNCAPYIAYALRSALDQDPAPLEIIVADDGSTDETRQVVQSFGSPVRYHRLEGSRNGAAVARNAAMQMSQGDYIAFLDADDVWLPGKLAAQLRVLEANPEVSLCATDFGMWRQRADGSWPSPADAVPNAPPTTETNFPPTDPSRSGWLYTRLLLKTLVWTSTVMIRRNLYERLGDFREELRLGQDYEYWLRASHMTPIITIDAPYALYRKRPDSATAQWAPVNYELIAVRSAISHFGTTGPDGSRLSAKAVRRRIGTLHFNMAYNQLWSGAPHRALGAAIRAAYYRPGFWRTWAYVFACAAATAAAPLRTLIATRRV